MSYQPPSYPPAPGPPPTTGYGWAPGSGHPVQLTIERAPEQSRVLALFSIPFFLVRIIVLLPALIVLYFVQIAMYFIAWIAQWGILFSGHYPEGMHRWVTGVLRWQTRVSAFLFGLTDTYPPFSTQP